MPLGSLRCPDSVAAVVGVRCGGVDVRVGKGGGDAPAEEEGAGTVAALLAGELAPTGGGGMDGGGAPAKAATPLATPPRRGRGRGGRGNGRGRGGRPRGGRGVAAAAAAAVAAALDGDAAVAAAAAAVELPKHTLLNSQIEYPAPRIMLNALRKVDIGLN